MTRTKRKTNGQGASKKKAPKTTLLRDFGVLKVKQIKAKDRCGGGAGHARGLPALPRRFKARRLAGILGRLLFHPSHEIEKEEKESRAGSE